MQMEKVQRVLVYVIRGRAPPQQVQFLQSVVGLLAGPAEDQVEVRCSLQNNRLLLSVGDVGDKVLLKRPSFCPIKHLAAEPVEAVRQQGVDVGVAILLQTANQRLLLTRRANTLRIFPNVWVPPGGHVEPDENLLEAGLRELEEETGLRPDPGPAQILGLWESVFPPRLSRGFPQRHHVVVYMLLKLALTDQELQSSLRPSPAEVSACVWLDRSLASAIVSPVDPVDPALPSSFRISEVSEDGSLTDTSLTREVFLAQAPNSGPDVERVSTGTVYALKLWLETNNGDQETQIKQR